MVLTVELHTLLDESNNLMTIILASVVVASQRLPVARCILFSSALRICFEGKK